jgi:chemotaxis response regulator CheB
VVIVQHVDERFTAGMAEWLGGHASMPVRLAREGDAPAPGVVLLAAREEHLTLTSPALLGYTPEPRDLAYRPSVDVFFRSVARLWKGDAVGVLLTGMGRDGALGLKALRDRGWRTIAQDAATSAVYGMPKAAAEIDAASEVLPLQGIAPRLLGLLHRAAAAATAGQEQAP